MSKPLVETEPLNQHEYPIELGPSKVLMYMAAVGTFTSETAKIYRDKLCGLLGGEKPDFSNRPAEIATEVSDLVEYFMNLDTEVHGEIPKLEKNERGIVIANHPSDLLLWPWVNAVAQNFTPKLKAVAKKEVMYDPRTLPFIFGWPGKLGELVIPVDRSNKESAVSLLRKCCKKILRPQNAVCIFPDEHRPTAKGIERSHKKMAKKDRIFQDLPETMPYSCFPKSGGLLEILSATEGFDMRIINTTVGASVDENKSELYGSTMHIHGEEVSLKALLGLSRDPKEQEAHLRAWLVEEWKRKNEMIRKWQTEAA